MENRAKRSVQEDDIEEQHERLLKDDDSAQHRADGDDDDDDVEADDESSSSSSGSGRLHHHDSDGQQPVDDDREAPSSGGANSQQVFLMDITEVASRLDLPVTSIIRPLMARQQREEEEEQQHAYKPTSSSAADVGGYDATQVLNSGPLHAPMMRSPGDRNNNWGPLSAPTGGVEGAANRRHLKVSLSSQDVEKLLKDDETGLPPPQSQNIDRLSTTSPVPPGSSAVTVAYNSSTDRFDITNSTRSIPAGAVAASGSSSKPSYPSTPLKGGRHDSSCGSSVLHASAATAAPPSNKRVGFAASEVQNVHVYEVDNSLFISIHYARPVFGWLVLLLAIAFGCTSDVVNVYHMGENDSAAYVYATWSAFGLFLIVAGLMFPTWLLFVRPSKAEASFLLSRDGAALVLVCGLMGAMAKLAQQGTAHIVQEWRWLSLSAVHPFLIVLFGKIFRNYVFVEEAVGSAVMLVGFVVALLAADTELDRWPFAEVVAFSQGIYIASFLFLAVKLRAKRVSVIVTASSVALVYAASQVAVCLVTGQNFAVDTKDGLGVFNFLQEKAFGSWLVESVSSSMSLVCYLLTLKFIPPLTVSAAMCIQVMLTQFASYLILFNPSTAIWSLCPSSAVTSSSPRFPSQLASPSPPLSHTQEVIAYCSGTGSDGSNGSDQTTRNTFFAVGSVICVFSAGYLVYVSSIKRSKVDMLLRHLSHRKTPRNPYEKKREDEEKFRPKSPLLPTGSGGSSGRTNKREKRSKRGSRGSLHLDSTSLHTMSGSSAEDERLGGVRRAGTSPPQTTGDSSTSDGERSSSGQGTARVSPGGTTRRKESPQVSKRNSGLSTKVVVHKATGNARVLRASSPPQQQSAITAPAAVTSRNQLDAYYDEV